MSEQRIRDAYIEQQAVELSMGLAIEDKGAYSVDEMRNLIDRRGDATAALEDALREDFRSMPPRARERMREMLAAVGESGREVLGILDTE